MLLFIALANAHIFLHGEVLLRGFPLHGTDLDHAVAGTLATLVDGRAYPMFAALFGYGTVQILRRQELAGLDWTSTRGLLRRRGTWLMVFGFCHATLLFSGDILGIYGLIGVVLVGIVRFDDKQLVRFAAIWLVVGAAFYGINTTPTSSAENLEPLYADPLTGMGLRAGYYLFLLVIGGLPVMCPYIIGVLAGRHGVLDDPIRHVRLLGRVATFGLGVAVLGGLPFGLVIARVWPVEPELAIGLLSSLHTASGVFGGLGYAAAIGLLATRWQGRSPGPIVMAVVACGQRSMTSYLLQSVVWFVVFARFLGDLGGRVGVAWTSALAVGTWVGTVVLAELMRRFGVRGPFEVLLRRLTYRKA